MPQAAANHPCADVVALDNMRGAIQHQFGVIGIGGAGQRGLVKPNKRLATTRLQRGNPRQQSRTCHAIAATNNAHRAKCAFMAVAGAGGKQAGKMLLRVGAIGCNIGWGDVEHDEILF